MQVSECVFVTVGVECVKVTVVLCQSQCVSAYVRDKVSLCQHVCVSEFLPGKR